MAKTHSALLSVVLLLISGRWADLVESAKEASKGIQHVSSHDNLTAAYPTCNICMARGICGSRHSLSMDWHATHGFMPAQGDQDQAELGALAKRSADGVIHFNPQLFDRYAVGKRRPYSLIFFLTATHLQDKSSLGLRPLRKQFGLLAKVCLAIPSCFRKPEPIYLQIAHMQMQGIEYDTTWSLV